MAVINNQVEIAIIGGGLIGMLTAHALLKSGASVVIFEKSSSAIESSWAGGGILSPLYPWRYPDAVNALAFKSQALYESLVDDIFCESGIDPQYWQCGMQILTSDIDDAAYQWLIENNVYYSNNCNEVRNEKRTKVNTNISVNADGCVHDFIHLPQIAQIRNPRFIKSLKLSLEKAGVTFSFNNAVSEFKKQADGQFSVQTEKGRWLVGNVVVCAGAWTSVLLSQILSQADCVTSAPKIKPVRGQMLLYKAPEKLISSIFLARGKYIIPRRDGHVLVGSTMEDVGFNKTTTDEAAQTIKGFVSDICPDLTLHPIVQHWAGLRPGSPDGTPYIGEHPEIAGLYINSGHFRNGVVMAPASALLMRDLILKNSPLLSPAPYAILPRKS